MNENKTSNKIIELSIFCISKNCPEFIEWDCGEGMCRKKLQNSRTKLLYK